MLDQCGQPGAEQVGILGRACRGEDPTPLAFVDTPLLAAPALMLVRSALSGAARPEGGACCK
eukprot:9542784-Heterocapsa_arctica.AAC.1